jgi:hypothetical protein
MSVPLAVAFTLGTMNIHSNSAEAANRAEATALLIRQGYRVYRPEADVSGEDLILRTPEPANKLIVVQLKSRPTVNHDKYGKQNIWMLFPDPLGPKPGRDWFLIEHDSLVDWWSTKHGETKSWETGWSTRNISNDLKAFLILQKARLEPKSGELDPL